jgi:anti-sigma B factor antagonist
MKFLIDRQEKFCIISLEEEKLNSLNAAQFKSELVMLNAEGVKNIIMDLGKTTFVDSSGLSSILVGNRLCKQANGTFVLSRIHDQVTKLLKISQLDSILNITPTNEEAVDIVIMEEVERNLNEGSDD